MSANPPQEVPEEVLRTLQRADGYLDLGMRAGAERELASIPEPHRSSVPCRKVLLRVLLLQEDWPAAAALAQQLRDENPQDAALWVHLAYATRRVRGLDEAYSVLKTALGRFPKEAVIPFNLACYECRLGRQDAALKFLERAFELEPGFREVASEDEDLEPLWDRIDE